MFSKSPCLALLLPALCWTGGGGLPACRGDTVGVTYDAVETWSVTLTYEDWGDGFTGARTFSGREVGRVTVRDGFYTLANKVGHHLTGLDPALTRREIVQDGDLYSVRGASVFAPAFGAPTHAMILLGGFIVSVPLINGAPPAFYDSQAYAGSGALGTIVGGGSMIGTSLTVSVQSTLALTVVPVPPPSTNGPFGTAAGSYSGVFLEPSEVTANSSGLLTARVDARGAFSARLTTMAGSAGFSGRFDAYGRSTNQVRLGTNTVALELELAPDSTGPLTGLISAAMWISTVDAQRAAFDVKVRPAVEWANRYTMRIRGGASSDQPKGDGIAAVQISFGGQVLVKGTLADGSPIVYRGALSEDGRWPVYGKLAGSRGFVLGWLEAGGESGDAISGVLHWSRRPGTKGAYPGGFDFTTAVEGSLWHPFYAAFLFENGARRMSFSDGDLASPVERDVAFFESCQAVAGPEKLQFKLSLFTGLFGGTYEPAGVGTKMRFKGALLPQQGYGAGFFTISNASGVMWLQ